MNAALYQNLSREELVVQLLNIQHELDQLKRLVFGSRHERFVPATPEEQLTLGLSEEPIRPITPFTETIEYTRIKKNEIAEKVSTGRMKLPADLPREKIIIEPTEDVSGMRKIGEEITEELDILKK